MDKKNIIIVIECVVLIIVSAILINKITKDEPEVEVANSQYSVFDMSECEKGSCEKEFKFNDNTININKESAGNFEIKYNDYVIFASAKTPYIGSKFYTFDDTVLFEVKDENGNITLKKYTIGEYEATNYELGEENKLWFIKSTSSKDNKMTIVTSRLVTDTSFMDADNEAVTDMVTCMNYREFDDRDAEQTFTFEYADGKFTEPKSTGVKKLNELSKYSSLCNQ